MTVLFCRLFILGCITQLQCFRWCFKVHTDTQHLRPERSCTEFFKRLTGNQAWQAVPAKICSLWTGYGGGKKKSESIQCFEKPAACVFNCLYTEITKHIAAIFAFYKDIQLFSQEFKVTCTPYRHATDHWAFINIKKMMQILNMSIWSNVVTKFEHAVKQNASK